MDYFGNVYNSDDDFVVPQHMDPLSVERKQQEGDDWFQGPTGLSSMCRGGDQFSTVVDNDGGATNNNNGYWANYQFDGQSRQNEMDRTWTMDDLFTGSLLLKDGPAATTTENHPYRGGLTSMYPQTTQNCSSGVTFGNSDNNDLSTDHMMMVDDSQSHEHTSTAISSVEDQPSTACTQSCSSSDYAEVPSNANVPLSMDYWNRFLDANNSSSFDFECSNSETISRPEATLQTKAPVPKVLIPGDTLLDKDVPVIKETSFEANTLQDLKSVMTQLTKKTRICFRDALYRLAKNSSQQSLATENQNEEDLFMFDDDQAPSTSMFGTKKNKVMELETNVIDRTIANLMFNYDNTQDYVSYESGSI